jgi:hypothetical protein
VKGPRMEVCYPELFFWTVFRTMAGPEIIEANRQASQSWSWSWLDETTAGNHSFLGITTNQGGIYIADIALGPCQRLGELSNSELLCPKKGIRASRELPDPSL